MNRGIGVDRRCKFRGVGYYRFCQKGHGPPGAGQMAKKYRNSITLERLKQALSYDPSTGLFTCLITRGRRLAGDITGTLNQHGYVLICIDGVTYSAHRLAWFYVTGCWPEDDIDHKDLQKNNNKFCNLRPATKSQNGANTKPLGKSGVKGVSWSKSNKRWHAKIKVNQKTIDLGRFIHKHDAAQAYADAAVKFFGEFARTE
jgi:hypothetical protein